MFLDQLKNGTLNINPYYFFIVFNIMGRSFDKITYIYSELETCELNRLISLTTLKDNLLITEIIILFATFLSLWIYLIFIDKDLNLIWELLRILAHNSFFKLKENIASRFNKIHEQSELIKASIDMDIFNNKEILKFKHSSRTISRFSILFIIAALFILLQSFVLENSLQNSLQNYPTLISTKIYRKVLLARITYYVLECTHDGDRIDSLNSIYPYYNTITTPKENALNTYNELSIAIDELRFFPYQSFFSQRLQSYIYKSFPSNSSFLITGTLNAVQYFIDESLNYCFNTVKTIDSNIYVYYNESQILYQAMNATAIMEFVDLKNLIDSQLDNLYCFSGGFIAILLMIYLFYYFPMLTFEIKFLNKLTDIIQIMPRHSKNTNIKSLSQSYV